MAVIRFKKLKRITRNTFLIILALYALLWFYDAALSNRISPKENPDFLRVGYINLHESQVSQKDLRRMKHYDCDLWCFLEWNGNNLELDSSFTNGYQRVLDKADSQTFGTLILSKMADTQAREVGNQYRPYTCDYAMYEVKQGKLPIYLVHAPPKLPGCNYERDAYITNLTSLLDCPNQAQQGLIIGDFNALPFANSVKVLKASGYQDTQNTLQQWPQGSFGFFPRLPKALKIDYILHGKAAIPKYVRRFSISNSDHSGFVADFQLSKS